MCSSEISVSFMLPNTMVPCSLHPLVQDLPYIGVSGETYNDHEGLAQTSVNAHGGRELV